MPRSSPPPASRADWMAARALLASRRLRPFVPYAVGAFVLVFAAVSLVRGPLAHRAAATPRETARILAAARDTVPLVTALQGARSTLAHEDSVLRVLQYQAEAVGALLTLTPVLQAQRDSLRTVLAQLDGALDRAAKAPLAASYRALAATRALRAVPGVSVLMDTLDLLDRTRRALDPVAAPQREFAQISQRVNAVGSALQALGQVRRTALVRQVTLVEASAGAAPPPPLTIDTLRARARRDSVREAAVRADSVLRSARLWHAQVQQRADSAARARAARILGSSPVAAAFSAFVVVMVLSFTLAVVAEARAPTIAHAREVERLTGQPVLATATRFTIPREGRARLQPGTGVDPFRMVYLALTASGTRHRVVCVTGDDASVTTAVAARLAVSAAADEHATLILDAAPGTPAASSYFGWREEPGFSEALAGIRLWREVARPIGAGEGMALDVVPAGVPRQDTDASIRDPQACADFTAFIAEYDFAVLVAAATSTAPVIAAATAQPPTILVVRVARTRLSALQGLVASLLASGVAFHGILLIDANS
ncbi:MAG: hypothetical protein P3B98_00760 [Gemmatimonadota bacterium]|nr:hypothetical protein [Gemmatimonadota bacterium]